MLILPPLSLYIHIPWCVRKCPYCDFNSHQTDGNLPELEYVQSLLDDLDHDLTWVQDRSIKSIFIGGGTPSLLSVHSYKVLFSGLKQRLVFADNIEITMEANPGTFEAEKFLGYRALGINRLSIGIQSFKDSQLNALGRIHNGKEAIRAVEMAKSAGFDNFNLDLMHGLPDQDLNLALDDINTALELEPTHISWYQLTIEPNTEFYKYTPQLPKDETLWAIQEAGQSVLANYGYQQYEVSAYGKKGRQAVHNLNYWQFGDYLGIGAGAHGKITLPGSDEIIRTAKTRLPKDYLNLVKPFLSSQQVITIDERPLEFMMNALRLYNGVETSLFASRTGIALSACETALNKATTAGLLDVGDKIVPTEKGRLFLNELLENFM